MYGNSPIQFKNVNVTNRLAAQLKQLVNANALPLTAGGNISLRRSQVTGQRQKKRLNLPALITHSKLDRVILKAVGIFAC